jgi:hypothetical protein
MLVKMFWNKNAFTLLLEMKITTTSMESSLAIPQKAKDRTAIWSSNTTFRHLPKEKNQDSIETPVHWCLSQHYSLFQPLETTQVPYNCMYTQRNFTQP